MTKNLHNEEIRKCNALKADILNNFLIMQNIN